ncbi:hypothetical protein Ccrd_011953 [Cynara cardunculus var. scolymus]|uniref:Uncharacterized protein n=1 Tax=Cynara cardunculus var. scolymus TaxID=59895 RepID=A0A118K5V8_CYNCS|nr:hypothetical protein Ccrd_011953 [Cynara cardunculus var. scolymus]
MLTKGTDMLSSRPPFVGSDSTNVATIATIATRSTVLTQSSSKYPKIEKAECNLSVLLNNNPKSAPAAKASKLDGEQSGLSSSQEKTFKKPNKILPCP